MFVLTTECAIVALDGLMENLSKEKKSTFLDGNYHFSYFQFHPASAQNKWHFSNYHFNHIIYYSQKLVL